MSPLPRSVLALPAGLGPILAARLPQTATVCSRSRRSKKSAYGRPLTANHQSTGCAARLRSCTAAHSATATFGPTLERMPLAGHAAGVRCAAAVGTAPANGLAVDMRDVSVVVGEGDKRKEVLRECYFAVAAGGLHMVLGANGCGKSTLLRAAGGLAGVGAGIVATAQPAGFVFQNPDHQVVLPTAGADVAFGLGGHYLEEEDVAEVVTAALAAVGLAGFQRRSCHTLSGGERQRLAVAGALAQAPAVLLLDELTSFLDAGDQAAVLRAVRNAVDSGGVTAVWVTHRLEELEWADGASYMDGGRVVVSGTVDRVRAHLRGLGAPV